MSKHVLKFYPVDNGDNVLIKLRDSTTILIDCNIREGEETDAGNKIFDVKGDLNEMLQKRNGKPYLDLFMLTHGDQDHCRGAAKNFYLGAPEDFEGEDDEIFIDEIWATSDVINNASNDDAKALKKEIERRIELWNNDDNDKNIPGNRIRMIGYDGDDKYQDVPSSVPGEFLAEINGDVKDDFELFIHGPFKKSLIDADANGDRNSSSIIMQARFKVDATDKDFSCYYLFGGDADHYRWKEVINKSKKHGHTEELKWDIFLSPHHCSWTFFNDTPYKDNKTPQSTSLDVLNYMVGDGKVIGSCKTVKNNSDDPPHYHAKQEYLKKLNKAEHFIELALNPKEKEPKPYVFEVTRKGPMQEPKKEGTASVAAGGAASVVNKKSEYGSQSI